MSCYAICNVVAVRSWRGFSPRIYIAELLRGVSLESHFEALGDDERGWVVISLFPEASIPMADIKTAHFPRFSVIFNLRIYELRAWLLCIYRVKENRRVMVHTIDDTPSSSYASSISIADVSNISLVVAYASRTESEHSPAEQGLCM